MASSSGEEKARVIFVGIGGATCSGKTTLAKHLRSILPNSFIIHQDDFAPPQELIPIHPKYNVQDWDSPEGAIDYARMADFLKRVRAEGAIPPDHRSHDHLNEQKDVPLPPGVADRWRATFGELEAREGGRVVWGLVDGFLLYWDERIVEQLDVRLFLRVPSEVLRKRRHERHGYHTAGERACLSLHQPHTNSLPPLVLIGPPPSLPPRSPPSPAPDFPPGVQSDPEGTLWRDPPHYWEHIVHPAYLLAHAHVFAGGDTERGAPTGAIPGLVLLEDDGAGGAPWMGQAVGRCCELLVDCAGKGKGWRQ